MPSSFSSSLSPRNQSQAALQGPGPPSQKKPPLLGHPDFAPELFKQVPDSVKEGESGQGWRDSELPLQVHSDLNSESLTSLPPVLPSQHSTGTRERLGRGSLLGREAFRPGLQTGLVGPILAS